MPYPADASLPWSRCASPRDVLLIGRRELRTPCTSIDDFGSPGLLSDCSALVATLEHFRATHGFGRGIAAPQIGILRRLVALELGEGPRVLCNPRIHWRSEERFTLWDDCMCFPWLMVRVSRHVAIELEYQDVEGRHHLWTVQDKATSELLQHELDHLEGVLAIDLAEGREALIAREEYLAHRAYFDTLDA